AAVASSTARCDAQGSSFPAIAKRCGTQQGPARCGGRMVIGPRPDAGSSMRPAEKTSGKVPPATASVTPSREIRAIKSLSARKPGTRLAPRKAIARTCALTCFSTSGYVREGGTAGPASAPLEVEAAGLAQAYPGS